MAIDFNGTNQDVSLIHFSGFSNLTITGWWYIATGAIINPYLVSQNGGGAANDCFCMTLFGNTDRIQFQIKDTNGSYKNAYSSILTINKNTWYHFAGVYKKNNYIKCFLDGVDVTDTSDTPDDYDVVDNGAMTCKIANRQDDSYRLKGRAFDVRLYNYALIDREIKIIYEAQGADAINKSALKGKYLLNEKTDGVAASGANSVIDISGQNNHGTPTNSPIYKKAPMRIGRAA